MTIAPFKLNSTPHTFTHSTIIIITSGIQDLALTAHITFELRYIQFQQSMYIELLLFIPFPYVKYQQEF